MSRRRILDVSVVVALASIGLGACSSQGGGTAGTNESVVGAGTSHVVWKTDGGGFGPQLPAGASCHYEASYDLDLGDGSLGWSICKVTGTDFNDPAAFSTVVGWRTLTFAERTHAIATAAAVKVSNVTTCGADLDSRSLVVEGTAGSITYGDDFYACEKLFDQYVHTAQLESLREVLDGMAHNP